MRPAKACVAEGGSPSSLAGSQSLLRKKQMERSNQPPKTEGCSVEGQQPEDLHHYRRERPSRSVPRVKREPQAGPASGLSNAASKFPNAGGDVVLFTEPNMCAAKKGEDEHNLPGSKSVARAEGDARNWGGPESSCRTNYEGQAGKNPPNKGASSEDAQGVRSAHSTVEASEGADTLTQSAQATSPVRMTEQDWQTFLRAIAEKAKHLKRTPCQQEFCQKLLEVPWPKVNLQAHARAS